MLGVFGPLALLAILGMRSVGVIACYMGLEGARMTFRLGRHALADLAHAFTSGRLVARPDRERLSEASLAELLQCSKEAAFTAKEAAFTPRSTRVPEASRAPPRQL